MGGWEKGKSHKKLFFTLSLKSPDFAVAMAQAEAKCSLVSTLGNGSLKSDTCKLDKLKDAPTVPTVYNDSNASADPFAA